MAMMKMSISDWDEVPVNPKQRDTERRAERASRKHLSEYFKTHDYVFAATIEGEIRWKLDGHTRSYLWMRGELDPPPSGHVQVLLIEVASKSEAIEIYEALDSKDAYKEQSDRIFGTTRLCGFRLRSNLLKTCRFGTYLKMADTGKFTGDPAVLVKQWKQELLDLDSLDLPMRYPTLISAMLMSLRRDGLEYAGPFWKDVYSNAGTKDQRGRDGVEALCHHMAVRVAQGRMAGYDHVLDIMAASFRAYEIWSDGRRVKRLGRANIPKLIALMKTKGNKRAKRSTSKSK